MMTARLRGSRPTSRHPTFSSNFGTVAAQDDIVAMAALPRAGTRPAAGTVGWTAKSPLPFVVASGLLGCGDFWLREQDLNLRPS
ncbi:hypothetical protein FHS95_002785, partial [Sphingomonas naasensis]|uniref:hypothetical protein n=1 Tax=Sphingomonas naasensis TaxID=1344951 RepID=UPI001ABA8656